MNNNIHTYFVAYIFRDSNGISVGNSTFKTSKTGDELVESIINSVTANYPNATITSISKID